MVICEKVVGIDDAYQSKLDQEAFEDICYDYAKCTKRLPEPADRLLWEIIDQTSRKTIALLERTKQQENYHRPRPGEAWGEVKKGFAGRIAVALGELTKAGKITKSENAIRMDELCDWEFRGGTEPEWIEEFSGMTRIEKD